MSNIFNEICINEEMMPKYTYIYIYCLYICIYLLPPPRVRSIFKAGYYWREFSVLLLINWLPNVQAFLYLICQKLISTSVCVPLHTHTHTHTHTHIYIYIYREREREVVVLGESDKNIEISGKGNKSNSYNRFNVNISFFINRTISLD